MKEMSLGEVDCELCAFVRLVIVFLKLTAAGYVAKYEGESYVTISQFGLVLLGGYPFGTNFLTHFYFQQQAL